MTMRTRLISARAVVFGLSATVAITVVAAQDLPLDEVPSAVMKAVKKRYPNGKITSASKEDEDGKPTYEISLKNDGVAIDAVYREDGTLVQIEKEIDINNLPPAVMKTVSEKHPARTIKKAEEVSQGVKVFFHVNIALDAERSVELAIDRDGKVLSSAPKIPAEKAKK
jgi:hypothetical protein